MSLLHMPCVLALLVPILQADSLPTFPPVEVWQDAAVDLAAFRTFCWREAPATPGTASPAETSVVWHAERELKRRGLEKVPLGPADLRLSFVVRPPRFNEAPSDLTRSILGTLVGVPLRGTAAGSQVVGANNPYDRRWWKVPEGTLVVEASRYADDVPVWQAATVVHSPDEKRLDAAIKQAVALLFTKFPSFARLGPSPPTTPSPR